MLNIKKLYLYFVFIGLFVCFVSIKLYIYFVYIELYVYFVYIKLYVYFVYIKQYVYFVYIKFSLRAGSLRAEWGPATIMGVIRPLEAASSYWWRLANKQNAE